MLSLLFLVLGVDSLLSSGMSSAAGIPRSASLNDLGLVLYKVVMVVGTFLCSSWTVGNDATSNLPAYLLLGMVALVLEASVLLLVRVGATLTSGLTMVG